MNASKLNRVLGLILVLSILVVPVPAVLAAPRDTTRVSVASDGTQGNDWSWDPCISADRRYVAFESAASNLVNGDTNGQVDVFVHDWQTRETSLVSVATSGDQGNNGSANPSISGDGRYVAFASYATNLVNGDTNEWEDVFVHDRQTGETRRVSVATSGAQGNQWSLLPSISADGRYVAFVSDASNLVGEDTNYAHDVFVHDRQTGETRRISVDSNGAQGDSNSEWPSISANGRYVVFASFASNLVNKDSNITWDVFVHDLDTGETSLVSVATGGAQGNSLSSYPSISADGRYVVFESYASNLVNGDTNDWEDVFVHDRQTGETRRVSVSSGSAQGNGMSMNSSISADGRYVAFESSASNLVDGDSNLTRDVFMHDRQTRKTLRVSVASGGTQGNSASESPFISADGRIVAFKSFASNLVSGDTNGAEDVFVHENVPPPSQLSFASAAMYDGWILESTEFSNKGGSMNASAATFNLGDGALDRQYRAVLSFDTSNLPDNAAITKATLKIKRQGFPFGTNPFFTHGGLKADIRKPYLGAAAGLAISDFQAGASLNNAATFSKYPAAGAWYSALLSPAAYRYINRTGLTQFRLRFAKDDNDDMSADYLKFFSGNTPSASYRPVLVVQYYIP